MATAENSKIVYGGQIGLFMASGATANIPLAFATSAKLSVSLDTREISSKDSGNNKEYASSKFSWTMGSENLLSFATSGATQSIDKVYGLFLKGVPVKVAFSLTSGSAPFWTPTVGKGFIGQAIITSISMNAPETESATYSIELQGTGALILA